MSVDTDKNAVSLTRDFWGVGCLWQGYSGGHLVSPGRDRQLSGSPGRKNKARNCPGRWTRGAYGGDTFGSIKDACCSSAPPIMPSALAAGRKELASLRAVVGGGALSRCSARRQLLVSASHPVAVSPVPRSPGPPVRPFPILQRSRKGPLLSKASQSESRGCPGGSQGGCGPQRAAQRYLS